MTTAPTPAPAAASGGGASAKSTSTKSAAKTVTKAGTTKKKVVRKVKKTGAKTGASAAQQAFAASRAAQMDLASLKNDAAARRLDPLWYRAEDVLPSVADDTLMSESATKILPEQIQIVEAALSRNNLSRSDVTPQAFACLLEQARRYAMEILTDSQDYAFVAGRTEIAAADLALANEFRPDHPMAVSTQVPKLNLLSQTVNRTPLPPIPTQCYSGVLLPPKHHQLTARTFDVVTSAQTARRMVQAAPPPPHKVKTGKKKSKEDKNKPSYGAARGRQISVNLKSNAKKDDGKKPPEKKTETEAPKTDAAAKPAEAKPADATKPAAADEAKDKPAPASAETDKPAATAEAPAKKDDKDDSMDIDKKEPADADKKESTPAAPAESSTTAAPAAPAAAPATGEGGAAPMDTSPSKP